MKENIVKGQYYRVLKDKAAQEYDRYSFVTAAEDVKMDDGTDIVALITGMKQEIAILQQQVASLQGQGDGN